MDYCYDENMYDIGTWGDQGNGLYRNPILFADYSDPDAIRVGEDFYMICSEFHFMGMPVLHSKDLVNWEIIGQVYNSLKMDEGYDNMCKFGSGSWAPALRYHNGRFYVFFCTPDTGLYMSSAENPAGPWTSIHEVKHVVGWEDPCPFWDEDGTAYLGRSVLGAGKIIVHKMSDDGKELLDDGITVYEGPVAEGTKFYKRKGWYYLIIPEGGVSRGWETALRAKKIYGPYEKKVVLEQGSTWVNGPHQGALIELENEESWFLHFSSTGALGRVCHLQPVNWVEDWPIMGYSKDKFSAGEPVYVWKKPNVGKEYPICSPKTSDKFDSNKLGCQWQWNHNPDNEMWSLEERPGYLRLKNKPFNSNMQSHQNIVKNTLTQKLVGASGVITVEVDHRNIANWQKAGLALIGTVQDSIYVERKNGILRIATVVDERYGGFQELSDETEQIFLRITINNASMLQFSYSLDGVEFNVLAEISNLKIGYWKGTRVGLYTYGMEEGIADFTNFTYIHDGPGGRRI